MTYNADAKELAATLTTADGLGLSSTNVNINIDGVDYTVKTNSRGIARLSLADLTQSSYNASVSYNGNSRFDSTSTTIEIDVT